VGRRADGQGNRAAIGKNDTAVSVWMVKHRDVCPKRFPERATAGPGMRRGLFAALLALLRRRRA